MGILKIFKNTLFNQVKPDHDCQKYLKPSKIKDSDKYCKTCGEIFDKKGNIL